MPEHVRRGIRAQQVLPALHRGAVRARRGGGVRRRGGARTPASTATTTTTATRRSRCPAPRRSWPTPPRYPAPGTEADPVRSCASRARRCRSRCRPTSRSSATARACCTPARTRSPSRSGSRSPRRTRSSASRSRARSASPRRRRSRSSRPTARSRAPRPSATPSRCWPRRTGPPSAATSRSARPARGRSACCRSGRSSAGVHANRTVAGSIAIQADVGDGGAVSFYMDCQPGAVIDPAPSDLAGATFAPAARGAVRRDDHRPAQRHVPQRRRPPRDGPRRVSCRPA